MMPLQSHRGPFVLVLVVLLLLSTVAAQEEHSGGGHAAAPISMGEVLRQLTRSGFVPLAAEQGHGELHVDVLYGHPVVYRAGGNEVPDAVYEGDEVIMFVTENIHAGEYTWDPVRFDLFVGEHGPIAPSRSELVVPDPHHRITRYHYRLDGNEGPLLRTGDTRLELRPSMGESRAEFVWTLPVDLGTVADHGLMPADVPLDLGDAPVLRVEATDDGYQPERLTVSVGEPVIIVFRNDRDVEHHFHVMDLAIDGTMRWLQTAGEADLFTDVELRVATQLPDHICTSEGGLCPTGQNVHLHANPGGSDAIAFVPMEVGTFQVIDPLHQERTAPFEVLPGKR